MEGGGVLTHESGDDPVEDGPGVPEPLLAGTKRLEVGRRFRYDISVQSELDPAQVLAPGGDVEVDSVGDGGGGGPAAAEYVGEDVEVGHVHSGGGRNAMTLRRDRRGAARRPTMRRDRGERRALPAGNGDDGEEGKDGLHHGLVDRRQRW